MGKPGKFYCHYEAAEVTTPFVIEPGLTFAYVAENFCARYNSKHGAGPGGEKEPLRAPSGALRIGKLTIEERRQRILRYRQKRHERNFKKRIKYACRKTLADSRPRIRGRFATNEEWDALKKKKAEEDAKAKAGSKK